MSFQLFSSLDPKAFKLLEEDCLKRGIQVPIEVDSDGNVLDGHNRKKIAEKHNLDYEEIVRDGLKTDKQKRLHVLMLNMARRQLRGHEWGKAFEQYLKLKKVRRGSGGDHRSKQTDKVAVCSPSKAAAELGVSGRTARRRLKEFKDYESLPKKWKASVDSGMPLKKAIKLANEAKQRCGGRTKKKHYPTSEETFFKRIKEIYLDLPPKWRRKVRAWVREH
jgi:hypothetical protein